MLYLSRIVGDCKYAVVDTDDTTEEIIGIDKLKKTVEKLGVEIKGVDVTVTEFGERRITRIVPYQMEQYLGRQQLKAKMLQGVDITVYRNEITSIIVDMRILRSGTRVDLSQYGTKLSEGIRVDSVNYDRKKQIILVVKDGMDLTGLQNCIGQRNICWDVSQVSDWSVVNQVYTNLVCTQAKWHDELKEFILDNERRSNFWYAIFLFLREHDNPESFKRAVANSPDRIEIMHWIEKTLFPRYRVIARVRTEFDDMGFSRFNELLTRSFNGDVDGFLKCKDYKVLREKYINVFAVVEQAISYNIDAIRQFRLFVECFEESEVGVYVYKSMCTHIKKGIIARIKASQAARRGD